MITFALPPSSRPPSPSQPESLTALPRRLAVRAIGVTLAIWMGLAGLPLSAHAQEPEAKIVAIEQALDKKNWPQAGEAIAQGLAEHPNDVRLQLLKGVWLARQGELNQAKRLFQEMTLRFPELSEPYNNLGIVIAELGDMAAAKVQFNKAVLADPSNTAAQNNLRRATQAIEASNR